MMVRAERRLPVSMAMRQVNWRGRSGQFYSLSPERLDSFSLTTSGLHMLARGGVPMWVGSANDVIHDVQSRSSFRLALEAADRAFAVEIADEDPARMSVVWDLEGAVPVAGLSAA